MKAKSLAREAKAQDTREALGQSVAKMPGEATQARRRFTQTHLPYANWCKECVERRARPDRRERTGGTKRGSVPEVSFDFCYTRATVSETKSARAVCWRVAIDSQTGFIHVAPLGSKNKIRLIVQKSMNFSQTLGYPAITYRSNNEATTSQSTTRLNHSKLGDQSFLSENTADRVRKLAGSFIEGLLSKLGIKVGSNHALWTCAARHAILVLTRFRPARLKHAAPYELVYGKSHNGLLKLQ